jgi:hypothetical protein
MALWDPLQFGTSQFLAGYRLMDTNGANAGAEITQSSGSISQFNDWSGNGRHATQSTGSLQPTYSSTSFPGSLPGASGNTNGYGGLRYTGGLGLSTGDIVDCWAVVTIETTPSAANTRVVSLAAATGFDFDGGAAIPIAADASRTIAAYKGGVGYLNRSSAVTANAGVVLGALWTTTSQTEYVNGTAGTASGQGWDSSSLITRLGLGCYANADTFGEALRSVMAEFVFLKGPTNSTDRQLVEGYLAWKWGLQANLPGGHTYAGAAPTVVDVLFAQSWF